MEDRRGLLLPDDIPQGSYRIVAGLYDDAGRYLLRGGQDSVTLTQINIVR